MTFPYVAGDATPDWFGSIEWPDLLISVNGTFSPLYIPPLFESAPTRHSSAPMPRGGTSASDPLLDEWSFEVRCRVMLDNDADIQGAFDYLRQKVNTYLGWQTVNLKGHGWSAAQTMTLRLDGQIRPTVEPEPGEVLVPTREIVIPVLATDPRRYGAAVTTGITTATSVTNAGTTPAPFDAVFVGPLTDAELNGPGTGNNIGLSSVASGQTITVKTVDPETGTTTLSDNLGTDPMTLFGLMVTDTADYIQPGTEAWTFTKSTGTGTASIVVSPAYA